MANSFDKALMGAAAAGGGPSDDQFNRVSFLSHFEGSNNGVNNAFDDGSASNHTITANGNVTQGSFGPFAKPDGEWGVRFPQNHPHYIDISSSSDFAIASDADYTFEFFIFYDSKDSDMLIMDYRTGGANGTFPVLSIAGDLNYDESDGSADTGKVSFNPHSGTLSTVKSASTLTFGAWNHVAIVRNSGTINFYINGTRDNNSYTNNTTVATAANIRFGDLALNSDAGADGNNSYYPGLQFSGVLSNFRFVNGTAVYSGSSITVPTSKLTAITNTKLLLFQSNRFVDNSSSGHTVPVSAGSPAVTAFGPFLTSAVYDPAVNGASLFNSAASDFLSFGNIGLDGHSGDFSIEGWIYPTAFVASSNPLYTQGSAGGVSDLLEISLNSSGQPHAFINQGSITLQSTFVCPLNAWTFLQLKRTSGTLAIFTNGVQSSTVSNTATISSPNRGFVGAQSYDTSHADRSFYGFICDVRVSVVTRNVSLPTAPLAVEDSNTKLLLNMADGQAIDSAAQDNITLEGGAKISTAQYKFGTSSILFNNAASCRASFKIKPFGTGDWTVEGFFRAIQFHDDNHAMWDTRPYQTANNGPLLVDESTPGLTREMYFYNGTKHFLGSASALSANTWYHIAVCRSGTSTKVFLDGTQVGSTISDSTDYVNETFTLGSYSYSNIAQGWDGYVDDFRISYMARYTSNFTAPAEPFADKGQ